MIADPLPRVFINPSFVPSVSDFIPYSIDSAQPVPTFRAPKDLSRSSDVIPSIPKRMSNDLSHRVPAITSHLNSITSAVMTRS